MKKIIQLLIVLLCLAPLSAKADMHATWDSLVSKHVRNGLVDYQGFLSDRPTLEAYLSQLSQAAPQTMSRDQKLALWINAYNALTVRLILENYPTASIRDIKNPWKQSAGVVAGQDVSLDEIEHDKLLGKLGEPLIHFAINCASRSCPPLWNQAYRAETITQDLPAAARRFIASYQHVRMETKTTFLGRKKNTLHLSKIFQWYADDFTLKGKRTIPDFIRLYGNEKLNALLAETGKEPAIRYQEYDWSLNQFAFDLGVIEPHNLARQQKDWHILDTRPRSAWRQDHIPGAHSFSWNELTRTDADNIRYRPLPDADLAAVLGKMGLDENAPLAIYGDVPDDWGSAGWVNWLLVRLGHQGPIRLLAGGYDAWKSAGLPLESGEPSTAPAIASYTLHPRTQVDISAADIQAMGDQLVLVDVRSSWEWQKGHLPNAIHIPWQKFFSSETGRPLDSIAMRNLLARHKVPRDKPIVYYCAGGIRSGYAWMAHTLSQTDRARNFEGGMEAWGAEKNRK